MADHAQSLKSATASPTKFKSAINPELKRWRSYSGVSWDRPDHGGAAKVFSNSVSSPICGIHFDNRGQAFVSTPRLVSSESPATISVLDLNSRSGPVILTAFPSVEGNTVSANPHQNLRSVLGFCVDRTNDWLWALDMGYVAGEIEAPAGDQQTDTALGYLILRVTIGLNIFMHGLSRILAGPANFAHILIPMFQHTFLSATSVYVFGLCLPWAEAAVGFFLLIGIYTRYVILAGALLMLSLTFGATVRQDWESAGFQLIYVAIYAALLAFRQYNQFSVGGYLRRSESD